MCERIDDVNHVNVLIEGLGLQGLHEIACVQFWLGICWRENIESFFLIACKKSLCFSIVIPNVYQVIRPFKTFCSFFYNLRFSFRLWFRQIDRLIVHRISVVTKKSFNFGANIIEIDISWVVWVLNFMKFGTIIWMSEAKLPKLILHLLKLYVFVFKSSRHSYIRRIASTSGWRRGFFGARRKSLWAIISYYFEAII